MDQEIVSNDALNVARGRKLFRRGAPWPEYDETDRSKMGLWVGYHAERAREFFERRRVKQLLGIDE